MTTTTTMNPRVDSVKRRGSTTLLILLVGSLLSCTTVECRSSATLPTSLTATAATSSSRAQSGGGGWFRQQPKNTVLDLRGGVSKSKRRKTTGSNKRSSSSSLSSSSSSKTATGKRKVGNEDNEKKDENLIVTWFKTLLPLTRIHLASIALFTCLIGTVVGEEMASELLALDPMRTIYGLEIWRYLTAGLYWGPPAMSWLYNGYHIFKYGSSFESAFGTSQYLLFFLFQITALCFFHMLVGLPFYSKAFLTATLQVMARSSPKAKVTWILFPVQQWSLPFLWILADGLQSQSIVAVIPHVIGICTGHLYYFHKYLWPKQAGVQDWLVPPSFVVRLLEPDRVKRDDPAKGNMNEALLKSRKRRGKGRKLGEAS